MVQPITERSIPDSEVIVLAVKLIRQHSGVRTPLPRLSVAARINLQAHDWASEQALDACIQQALVLCRGPIIETEHLQLADANARRATTRVLRALRAAGGQRKQAAGTLGISPRTLRYKLAAMRASGLPVPAIQPARLELEHE